MVDNDLPLKFVCPICSAGSRERCRAQVGVIRYEFHPERVELANIALLDSEDAGAAPNSSAIYLVPPMRQASYLAAPHSKIRILGCPSPKLNPGAKSGIKVGS